MSKALVPYVGVCQWQTDIRRQLRGTIYLVFLNFQRITTSCIKSRFDVTRSVSTWTYGMEPSDERFLPRMTSYLYQLISVDSFYSVSMMRLVEVALSAAIAQIIYQ